ncbi:hypothetical protein [Methanosalsum natronophilum]|nr:hypothetical protein [Methanosalsum natronophilum]MCS3924218.1 uncharacterized protein with PIN domain [Methanosalsum natronophilum]
MFHICPKCNGRMNRWRRSLIKREDMLKRQNYIYKCLTCGNEQEYFD